MPEILIILKKSWIDSHFGFFVLGNKSIFSFTHQLFFCCTRVSLCSVSSFANLNASGVFQILRESGPNFD